MELNESSSDKNSNVDNTIKVNDNQTTQAKNQTSHNIKADEEISDETLAAKSPTNLDKKYLTSADLKTKLTSNYFCFDCGAVLTTLEDKKQHELFEIETKDRNDLENGD
ncbi:hypothetical protein [Candidatus Nitrosocosmicus sp. R]